MDVTSSSEEEDLSTGLVSSEGHKLIVVVSYLFGSPLLALKIDTFGLFKMLRDFVVSS